MATKQPSASEAQPAAPVQTESAEAAPTLAINTPATPTMTYIDLATGLPVSAPPPPAAVNAGEIAETPEPEKSTSTEAQPEKQDEHLFTQAEVERIIRDRLDRQKRRYEQLAKGKTDEAESEQPADTEQAAEPAAQNHTPQASTAQPETWKVEIEQIRNQLASVSVEVTQARIGQAIAVEAQRIGVDAGLAAKLIEPAAIEVRDGMPVAESIGKALDALVERYPNLRTMPSLSAANPARTQQRTRTDDDRRNEYFGGGKSSFWDGGGISITTTQEQ